jgi:hypothetical protein
MSTARFRPRDYAVEPDMFGKTARIAWVTPLSDPALTPGEQAKNFKKSMARLGAAQIQHSYSRRIRARIKHSRMNLVSYARQIGAEYDRTSKVLRGEIVMTFEDIVLAHNLFGDIYESTNDLRAPTRTQ